MDCNGQDFQQQIGPDHNGHARARQTGFWQKLLVAAGLLAAFSNGWPATTYAQTKSRGRYFPLDQTAPPGTAAKWAGVQRGFCPVMQPVRVDLPEGGLVSFYSTPGGDHTPVAAGSIVGLQVGSIYRLKISDLPGTSGVELYPTIELIDRLHPPRGRELEFPIPIVLTAEEISLALEGRLITKVVYLEQPDRADPIRTTDAARSQFAHPRENVLALADEAGRPMAIVRLGGREPDAGAINSGFYGTGAPVQVLQEAASSPKVTAR
jgi:hypothetical protein